MERVELATWVVVLVVLPWRRRRPPGVDPFPFGSRREAGAVTVWINAPALYDTFNPVGLGLRLRVILMWVRVSPSPSWSPARGRTPERPVHRHGRPAADGRGTSRRRKAQTTTAAAAAAGAPVRDLPVAAVAASARARAASCWRLLSARPTFRRSKAKTGTLVSSRSRRVCCRPRKRSCSWISVAKRSILESAVSLGKTPAGSEACTNLGEIRGIVDHASGKTVQKRFCDPLLNWALTQEIPPPAAAAHATRDKTSRRTHDYGMWMCVPMNTKSEPRGPQRPRGVSGVGELPATRSPKSLGFATKFHSHGWKIFVIVLAIFWAPRILVFWLGGHFRAGGRTSRNEVPLGVGLRSTRPSRNGLRRLKKRR